MNQKKSQPVAIVTGGARGIGRLGLAAGIGFSSVVSMGSAADACVDA